MSDFNKVKALKDSREDSWLSMDGVHSIGIGEDKSHPGEFCIYLHVDPAKVTKASQSLSREIEGVKIEIQGEEMAVPHVDDRTYRPLRGGCQIQPVNTDYGGGTLGCMVRDNVSGKICILSNKHVLPNSDVSVGQPTSSQGHLIGKVLRNSGISPLVDGAIAEMSNGINWKAFVLEIGAIEGTYTVTENDILNGGYRIRKRGRTTELTNGVITQLEFSGMRSDGWQFQKQLYVGTPNFSKHGDSGAVYVDGYNRVVGLNWGSSKDHSSAAGSPIAEVLQVLSIEMLIAQFHKTVRQESVRA